MKHIKMISAFLSVSIMFFSLILPATASGTPQMDADGIVYVNGEATVNGNGERETPFNSFADAMNAISTAGGTVVVIGKTVINTLNWGAGGTVILTSVDPVTGKDYRGTDDSGAHNGSGASLVNRGSNFASTTSETLYLQTGNTNTVEFRNIDYVSNGPGFLQMNDHDAVIENLGHYRSADLVAFTVNDFNMGFDKAVSGGKLTVVLDSTNKRGNISMGATGAGGSSPTATLNGLDLTVNSFTNLWDENIKLGNRPGGTCTVTGDVYLTLNMQDKVKINWSNMEMAEGTSISVIVNPGSKLENYGSMPTAPRYELNCVKGVRATHGNTAQDFLLHAMEGTTQAVVVNSSGDIVSVLEFTDGESSFHMEEAGKYKVYGISVNAIGAQKATNSDGSINYRFLATVPSTECLEGVGIEVTYNDNTKVTADTKRLEKSLTVTAEGGEETIASAADLGAVGFTTLIVEKLSAAESYTFSIRTFVIINGNTYYGAVKTLTASQEG